MKNKYQKGGEEIVNLNDIREFWITERLKTSNRNNATVAIRRPPSRIIAEQKKTK